MNADLRKLILQKCRKKVESYEEEEECIETISEQFSYGLEESETIQEPPFQDILADKRRTYSVHEEFMYLLHNDLLQYFVKQWDGKYLRKKPKTQIDSDSEDEYEFDCYFEESYEDIKESNEKSNDSKCNNHESQAEPNIPWKLTLHDEFATITFINNNTYSGRISRKMMEGQGVYRWSNGAQYKGDFQQNQMHGRGLLEWNCVCWYEGDFENGLRHGRGLLVDGNIHYMYTGHWSKDQKHGKGYCRYENKGSYDGDWVMNKMSGVGLRIYASGARYVGQWKNGLRHGTGTMVWTNGSVYRGEWMCGTMNGYGKYIWNGFFNQTLTWPQEAYYVGYWRNGIRHGKGVQTFNSISGAKYFGYWENNKKHGCGMIIGNNGEKLEADPLFLKDILVASDTLEELTTSQSITSDEPQCVHEETEIESPFLEEPEKLKVAPITPVTRPEQFPCLSYHLTRLLDPKALEPPFIPRVPSGKCYACKTRSCSCLKSQLRNIVVVEEEVSKSDSFDSKWEFEKNSTYDYIISHIVRLRQIYNDYATLFTKSPPMCNLTMTRLCLWQLWRDSGVHRMGFSLTEIDNYIAENESTCVQDVHNPLEKIEIWQFLHALLEVAWRLYIKYDTEETEQKLGKLASGLSKFLENDIYPHAGNHVGEVWKKYRDLVPLESIFKICNDIGYPCSARDFLLITCTINDTQDSRSFLTTDETAESLPDGINSVTIGEKVSYLLKLDNIFAPLRCAINVSKRDENDSPLDLSVFGQLRASKLVEIMASICPAIKDTENGVIINIDYKLTLLEFYEVILEATKQLILLKEKAEKEMLAKEAEANAGDLENNLQDNASSKTSNRKLSQRKSKTKNRISK